jgi:DNA-binding response OmpR family regulator
LRVLVVEDDDHVAAALSDVLGTHGHSAVRAASATEARNLLGSAEFVLLDLGLPDADGLDVLREIRCIGDTAVLVLTARGDEREIVLGLRLGADDYLVKPVRARELMARINAVARRATVGAPPADGAVEIGVLSVDPRARRATVHGREIPLTTKEFDVLAVLTRRPGGAVSRQQVMDEVWGDAHLAASRALDVHVAQLRGKLAVPGLLVTIRGFGYRLGG